MTCRNCAYDPACTTRAQMRARHGTPAEFERAVWNARDGLMCSNTEAARAIVDYRTDYSEAPE